MLPCLNNDALKLLVGTADERYAHSPEYFRKTHFPQVMHKYHGNQLHLEVTENELFEELIEIDSKGNRLYFLFGSTGSGKSELLCWIKDRWHLSEVKRPVIRISRTELNPQILIKKCFEAIGIPLNISIDETRWELLLKKPITLINQIVWSTLSEILPSDDEIVPAALMIRPIIEKNVTEFTMQVKNARIKKPLEVLYQSQYDELILSTTLQMPIDYQLLRKTLSKKLDQFLFEGWDIGSLFKHLTDQLKTKNIRPLLLIDDLVQSVNIYATDLLDQLINLEEGNWDVVIGLTPGAIQGTDRGFDLTQRIQNLDTITDRVKKLWLSDESGKDFYNLDRTQVTTYMSNYLVQLKESQGFKCSKQCSNYSNCKTIVRPVGDSTDNKSELQDVNLLPFNSQLVKRTFDAIPMGKGKLRYMILNSKEIIRFFLKGKKEGITRVIPIVKREKFSDHTDIFIKTYAEWFVPEDRDVCFIPKDILSYFGYQDDTMKISLYPLESEAETIRPNIAEEKSTQQLTRNKLTVREWVEGNKINTELLDPVRQGVSALIHDALKGVNVSREFTPRMTAVIQRKNMVNRTRYPIAFEIKGRSPKSIFVDRGYASLQISNFQLLKYSDKTKLFQQISNEYETASWIYQSEELKNNWKTELDKALGMPINSFVYLLKNWVETCLVFGEAQWTMSIKKQFPLNQEMLNLVEQSYQDWFFLRDNMVEPTPKVKRIEFDRWIKNYVPKKELEFYQIGETSLYAFLLKLKMEYESYLDILDYTLKDKIQIQQAMIPFLLGSQKETYYLYADSIIKYKNAITFSLRDYVEFTQLEECLEKEGIYAEFELEASLYQEVDQLYKSFGNLCEEINAKTISEDILSENWNNFIPDWSNLLTEKAELLKRIDLLTLLNNSLSISRDSWQQVLDSEYASEEVLLVKKLYARLVEIAKGLVNREPTVYDIHKEFLTWQSIDFYDLKSRIEVEEQRLVEKQNVIRHIQSDLGESEINNIKDLIYRIEFDKGLRPTVKRHLIALLEHGYTTLPPVQWRRLIDELKAKFPTLFQVVEIRLVASRK